MASNIHKQNHHHHEEEEEFDDTSFLSAMLLCFSQIHSAALNTAVELNLFDIIANIGNGGHVSAAEVASHLPSSSQHKDLALRMDRLLRLLANQSLLTCNTININGDDCAETERLYGISSVGKFFVNGKHNNTGGSVALFSSFMNHRALVDTWLSYKGAIIDKDTDLFKKVHGIPMYQYEEIDQTLNKLFNNAMANLNNIEKRRILEIYKGFEGISTLVDVGGGTGQNLNMIISKYPSIKGINFDLPHVIQNAPPYPGIEHVGGDMFESVPKGDVIILKAVCHNWSDENCIKILRKCHEALPQNGKVIVVESLMPETNESIEAKFASSLDNLMFIHDGRERTQKQFESLCKRSGFSTFKVACCVLSVRGVMEFHK